MQIKCVYNNKLYVNGESHTPKKNSQHVACSTKCNKWIMTSVHDTLLCNTEHINVNFENNNYHTLLKMNSDKTYPKALRPGKAPNH